MAPKTKTVGQQVAARMAVLGMSQADVARATGIAPSNLSDLIHDKKGLGPVAAWELGTLLDLDPRIFDRRAQAKAQRASGGPRRKGDASPASDGERRVA